MKAILSPWEKNVFSKIEKKDAKGNFLHGHQSLSMVVQRPWSAWRSPRPWTRWRQRSPPPSGSWSWTFSSVFFAWSSRALEEAGRDRMASSCRQSPFSLLYFCSRRRLRGADLFFLSGGAQICDVAVFVVIPRTVWSLSGLLRSMVRTSAW